MKLIDLFEKSYNFRLGNASFVKVLENPSYTQIIGECNRILRPLYLNYIDIEVVDLRGLFTTETFLLWSAWDATHDRVMKEMDIDKYSVTTFVAGFSDRPEVSFGYEILRNGGNIENHKSYFALMKALPAANKTMREFRQENIDKLID